MNSANQANPVATGWGVLLSGKNGLQSIVLAAGVVLHAVNVYLATTILPSVVIDIGGLEFYAWNTTLFVIASVVGSVLSSRWLVSYGPRKAYLLSILLFLFGTFMNATAPVMAILLAGRVVQGFGGGLLFALAYAMIRLLFIESLWTRAMALVSSMWGVAALSGPFIGGIFAQYSSWRSAFWVLMGLGVLLMILTGRILPRMQAGSKPSMSPVPILKLALLVIAVLSISVGSISEGKHNLSLMSIGMALVCFGLLIGLEKKSNYRLLPHGAYQISSTLGTTYVVMALLVMGTTTEIFIPYLLQTVHGFPPLRAGYLTVLLALGWTFASVLFSGVSNNTVHLLLRTSPIIMAIGLIGLSRILPLPIVGLNSRFWMLCGLLLMIGVGIGMGWPHLLARVLTSAQPGEEEMASASITTVQLVATSLGAALGGLIANMAGLLKPGGISGAVNAAHWLFMVFSIGPFLAFWLIKYRGK